MPFGLQGASSVPVLMHMMNTASLRPAALEPGLAKPALGPPASGVPGATGLYVEVYRDYVTVRWATSSAAVPH